MKLILILICVLLSVAVAVKIRMPFRKAGILREKMIRNRRYQQLQIGRQGLLDTLDDFYLAQISLGTPAQNFSVALDTTTSNLWVLDVNCISYMCKGNSSTLKDTFNSTASSTFLPGDNFTLPYLNGQISGNLGKDTLKMAGFNLHNQSFGIASSVSKIYTEQPVDGVLGLGWPAFALNGTKSPMENLLSYLDAPIITIFMARLDEVGGKVAGYITYGTFDNTACSNNVQYVPLALNSTWAFTINAVQMGTYSRVKNEIAISATGSGWTGVPNVVFNAIIKQTKAFFDWNDEIYVVPCSKKGNLPDITIAINGGQYVIESDNYVVDVKLNNGNCALAFFGTDFLPNQPNWILGDAFIRSYCHVLDFGNARIGLAKAV